MDANFFQVAPSSSEIYKPGTFASTIASTSEGLEGLIVITILPKSPSGNPLVILFQVFPPSVDLCNPLPGPPELKA